MTAAASLPPSPTAAALAAAGPEPPLLVLVVASYPAVRAGLASLLGRDPGLRPVERQPELGGPWEGTGGALDPAVLVVEAGSISEAGLDAVRSSYPATPLVLLGADPGVDGPGLGLGPVAYLSSDIDGPTLVAAVHAVALGLTVLDPEVAGAAGVHAHTPAGGDGPTLSGSGEGLTSRERQVLALVADGLPNKAIARELGISEHTVKFHVGSLLGKLDAGSRTEAVTQATRRGILSV